MKEDPPIDFKCKDKFLVQSVAITAEREQLAPADLWPTIERDARDQIREKKIRCVFLAEHEITQIKEEEAEQLTSSRSSSAAQSAHSTINSQPAPQTSTTTSSETPVSTASLAEIAALKRELQAAQETIQKLQGEASV
ncbi:phosphatidylinositol-binding protein scs2, partial [Entomortierella chlamydospora]